MSDPVVPLLTLPLFFFVAFLYASVGHGGASGYLALFAVLGIAVPEIVPTALTLNILVASMGFYHFRKSGHFDRHMLWPFVLTSIPAAFLGGMIDVPRDIFYAILGAALLLSSWRLLMFRTSPFQLKYISRRALWIYGAPIGGGLGLLAGMIGIGGGVFLSPMLLLLRWADAKKTAALSAAFIVLNSLSGLAGHIAKTGYHPMDALPLALAVGAGGFIGSRTGAFSMQPKTIRFVLAVVLVMAGTKLVGKSVMLF